MLGIYNTALYFYRFFIGIASIFDKKARLWIEGRKNWRTKLRSEMVLSEDYYWMHCASLGEFEQGRPIIEAIKERLPDAKILLTFYSPSGYEIRKNYALADIVSYLPLDSKRNAQDFISIVQPKMALFIKYDLWYHYLNELHSRQIPSYLISAHFKENQIYFNSSLGKLFRKMLSFLSHIFVQDKNSELLLDSIQVNNVSIAGDTRFDRVSRSAENNLKFEELNYIESKSTLVAGSTWPKDNSLLEEFWQDEDNRLNHLIIAAHEIHTVIKFPDAAYYSQIEKKKPTEKVLIIDNIGMLSSLYAYGSYAYIGGGFGKGIHNILEAAVFGVPIFFGPNYSRFQEAIDLIELGGAFSINSVQELKEKIAELESDAKLYQKVGQINKDYVLENIGATDKVISSILNPSEL